MKNILLKKFAILSILTMCVYSLVSDADALLYNGGGTYMLPDVTSSGGTTILYENSINGIFSVSNSSLSYYQNFGVSIQFAGFGCFKYDSNTTSGYLASFGRRSYSYDIHGIELYLNSINPTSMDLEVYLKDDIRGNILGTGAVYILQLPKNPTSPGGVDEAVVCFHPNFLYYQGQLWLQFSDVSYYNLSSGGYYFSRRYYGAGEGTSGLSIGTTPLNDVFTNAVYTKTGQTNATGSYRVYDRYQRECYSSPSCQKPLLNSNLYVQDFMLSTGSTFYVSGNTLPIWLNSTGGLEEFSNIGDGDTNSEDYFSECTSFLDVGCFIKAQWNTFLDFILPDINFNGFSDTCIANYNTGSTLTGNGITTGFMQKITNLFVILVPTAPVDNTDVCMLGGRVETIHYNNGTNYFDIAMVLSVFFVVFLSLHHKKHD